MLKAPCKNCTERKPGCHSKCKSYMNYYAYRRHLSKLRKIENQKEQDQIAIIRKRYK